MSVRRWLGDTGGFGENQVLLKSMHTLSVLMKGPKFQSAELWNTYQQIGNLHGSSQSGKKLDFAKFGGNV